MLTRSRSGTGHHGSVGIGQTTPPGRRRAESGLLRLTLLGVGAMNSPRYPPAGLLVRFGDVAMAFDGGPGAEPPDDIDMWLVTDERSELRVVLSRLAGSRGVTP